MKRINLMVMSLILPVFMFISIINGYSKEAEKIKVGVILPMTGDLASYGEPMKEGMEMALLDLNKNKSKNFDLIYVDSKAEPKTAISGLQKLLSIDKVKYIIGDVSSPVTLALVPIAEKNKVFLISPGASSPKLGNISPFFARNYPSSVDESRESAKFLAKNKHILKTAIIYVNSEYGLGLKDVFTKTYELLGGKVIFSEAYKVGNTNFRDIITKMKGTKPEAIYLGGNQKEMGNFIRQLREYGSKALVLSNISFLESDCLNIAKSSANGVIVPVAYYNPTDPLFKSAFNFATSYKKKTQKDVTIPIAVGYDSITLIAKGIGKFGNNPEKVASFVRNLKKYDGALGLLNFSNGDVSMPVEFKVVKDGKAVTIKK
jgi:branched-chain amino acid transport system substrate-binding protein